MELYHGTGAKFNRFSNEHINTGEEVQKYGYGIYLTNSIDVAKYYASRAAGDGYVYKVKIPNSLNIVNWNESIDPYNVGEMAKKIIGEDEWDTEIDEMNENREFFHSDEKFEEIIETLLVDGANVQAWEELEEEFEEYDLGKFKQLLDKSSFQFYIDDGITYQDVYQFVSDVMGGPTATKLFRLHGIDGFKFPSTEVDGAINVTVFDADNIKIIDVSGSLNESQSSLQPLPQGSDAPFYMDINQDSFIHFTTLKRAKKIVEDGKLEYENDIKLPGARGVYAVSLSYGQKVPSVQLFVEREIKDEGPIVAVYFKTTDVPKVGFPEEVVWKQDVTLNNAKIIEKDKAMNMLGDRTEDDFHVTYTKPSNLVESFKDFLMTFDHPVMESVMEGFSVIFESSNDSIILFHGTIPNRVQSIESEGIKSKDYHSPQWYMLSSDFESALYHADGTEEEGATVFKIQVPIVDKSPWSGYPYLWPEEKFNNGRSWYALKQPIPSEFIVDKIVVPYEQWSQQKSKGF